MVTLAPRDADRDDGDWVIWISHLASKIGKLKTNPHMINSDVNGFSQKPSSTNYRKQNKFIALSFLPVSHSSSKPRS